MAEDFPDLVIPEGGADLAVNPFIAKNGDLRIWTSSLTLAEVYKPRAQPSDGMPTSKDKAFEEFLLQDFIVEAHLDHDTAVDARSLLRQHPQLKRAQDAVHLATARLWNCDELQTFDGKNLLPLNGQVYRADGKPLLIREPPPPVVGSQTDMFIPQPPRDPETG